MKEKIEIQPIIDKYLKEFYEVQRMKIPIEFHPYLHRMIKEVLEDQNT